MSKKIISSILIIVILTLWMPIEGLQEVFNSVAVEIKNWEYNYTGDVQTFTSSYKGIYQIELYGAQGGTHNSYAVGGKGSYQKGVITLDKNQTLNVYVGGQNGYNGGGIQNGYQLAGGGATDIRYGGTETSNRILVAAGGGGSCTQPVYHTHVGSIYEQSDCYRNGYHEHEGDSTKGTGCYTKEHMDYVVVDTITKHERCTSTSYYYNDRFEDEHGEWYYAYCSKCYDSKGTTKMSALNGDTCNAILNTTTQDIYDYVFAGYYDADCGGAPINRWVLSCTKTEGETIDSYTYTVGATTALSNEVEYQGSEGGGGGYYGGQTGYAGTSYANATYLTQTTTQEGVREGNGYVKITLLSSPPEVELTADITENTNKNVTLTATATDNIGFPTNPYSWNGEERISSNKFVATKNGTYTVNVINESEMTTEKSYTVSNIDKIAPKINSASQLLSEDRKSTTITVNATDSSSNDYIATGVTEYAITKENKQPSSFSSTNEFTVNENGTYYAWAKDAVGNISEAREILVPDIEIEILGNITWNDSSNKYSSRKASNIRLYRKLGQNGTETLVETQRLEPGQTEFSFQTRQCDDSGNEYIFRIEQDNINGYETLYTGNSVSSDGTKNVQIDITNNLVLPTYTSDITIEPKDSFENKLLKNGQAKITATIEASDSNKQELGVHTGQVVLNVDSNITINKNSIIVTYQDVNGNKTNITNYSISGNTITTIFGNTNESISTKGSKVTIEVEGTLKTIGNYNNKVSFSGKLRDYRGTNTDINLGTITQKEGTAKTEYQLPEAKIQIRKVDSITEQALTDATFTLYEWNGSEYIEKEIITDTNKDGIYESKA